LISNRGLAAYGTIDARVTFEVSAFIYVPGIAWETRRFQETISISLTIGYMKCKRWRCRWKTETVTRSWTVIVEVPVPVPVMKRYESGPQRLALRLRGGVAFEESGTFGFSGQLTISTRVAGFRLEISPALRSNPAIVDRVRQRVAAIEDHLNSLRGMARPGIAGPSGGDDEEDAIVEAAAVSSSPPPEKWFHYTSQRANAVYHVLVPSPEDADAWYTPESHALSEYSNLPLEYKDANDAEKQHRSPFRHAVMRMQLTFKTQDGETRIVDLTMPWDRLNMDALAPDEPQSGEEPPTHDERVRLLIRLSEMETAFLNTASERKGATLIPCESERLRDVTIVSDPRVESSTRQFWTLPDQRIRPDYAPPAVFRSVDELVSEGFAGLAKQGDIGRLLLFDRLSRRAARLSRHGAVDPTDQERLAQARGAIVRLILDDLQREDGPRQFGVMPEIQVARVVTNADQIQPLVARRRAPVFVKKSADNKYEFHLTKDVLLNSTDLDLEGTSPFSLAVDWGDGTSEELSFTPPEPLGDEDVTLKSHPFVPENNKRRFYVTVTRSDVASEHDRCSSDVIVAELVDGDVERQVGLIVRTEGTGWQLEAATIIRFEDGTATGSSPVTNYVAEKRVNLVHLSAGNPRQAIERLHGWLECLPACQQFLGHAKPSEQEEASTAAARPRERVRVSLPVKIHEELLRNQLPELNRFQIFRQFPWDAAPVLVDDQAFPRLEDVQDQRKHYRLLDSFLYTEDFELELDERHGRPFVTDRLQPETTVIRYWLRAVPYGGLPASGDRLPMLAWPPVRLYVPPKIPSLPDVGIVVPVAALRSPATAAGQEFEIRLVDRQGGQIVWGGAAPNLDRWPALEIWAEQRDLSRSGFYTGDDISQAEGREQAARGGDDLRKRGQLAAESLPRSAEGRKFRLVTIPPSDSVSPGAPQTCRIPYAGLSPGFAYRLLVRLAIPAQEPLLTPVPVFLVRQLPERIEAHTPLRSVETLEFISGADWDRILDPESQGSWLDEEDFDATSLTESPSVADFPGVRIGWSAIDQGPDSVHDGGVEILIQDYDESHRLDRIWVEVQDEAPFQEGHRDFRNASAWQAHCEINKGILRGAEVSPPAPVAPVPLHQYYLWEHERNPVLERMAEAYANVIGVDGAGSLTGVLSRFAPLGSQVTWTELHDALSYWFAAVFDYRRTPLAIGDAAERQAVDAMVLCAVHLLAGIKVETEADPARLLAKLEEREKDLREMLDEIVRSDPRGQQVQDRNEEYERLKWELLDYDTADRLAKIVLRRQAFAEELFQPEEGGIGNTPEALHMQSHPNDVTNKRLPRADAWDDLVALYNESSEKKDEQGNVKYAFPLTKRLLDLFEREVPLGQTGAIGLQALILAFYQKAAAVRGMGTRGDAYHAHRARLAGLVPQAAGLTAALNALKRDLGDRGWTLLLRPHQQLLAAEDGAEGRSALPVKLDELMPDCFRTAAESGTATKQALSGSTVAFFNLLERLGFAVDLGVTDDLQRLLSQQELLDWIRRFPWPTILRSADPQDGSVTDDDLGHDVFICIGREPDTTGDVDAPGALGYPFLKLAVVPRGFWTVVRQVSPALGISAAAVDANNTLKAKFSVAKTRVAELGFQDSDEVAVNFPGDVVLKFTLKNWNEKPDGTSEVTAVAVTGGDLPSEDTGSIDGGASRWLSRWLHLRKIDYDAGDKYEAQVKMLTDVAQYVDKLARPESGFRFVLVEQRAERWLTVPSLGRRSHVAWTAPHRYGQRYRVAVRRVSRYEPLVHWYLGTQTPAVGRIPAHALDAPTVDLRRCHELADDEEATLPVQIQPHPHRIQFLYGLPSAGTRSLLSRLSSVRTGYRGVETSFAYQPNYDQASLETLLQGHVAATFIQGKVDATDATLLVASGVASGQAYVLMKPDGAEWRTRKVMLTDSSGKWKVDFASETILLTANEPVLLIPLPEENGESPYLAVWAKPLLDSGMRLDPNHKLVVLSGVDDAYAGMVAELFVGSVSKGLRLITGYSAASRTISLNENVPAGTESLRIWRLEPQVHQEPIPVTNETPTRLFRHERMLALNDLPYFFAYNLRVDPLYDVQAAAESPGTSSALASRRPAALGVKRASIKQVNEANKTYEFTVYLSRLEDHLTPRELDRLKRDFSQNTGFDKRLATPGVAPFDDWHKVRPWQLPDLAMSYHILWKATADSNGSDESEEPFFVPAVDVVLPQNERWTEPNNAAVLVRPRSPSQLTLLPSQSIQPENGELRLKLQLNRWAPNAAPVYAVTFQVRDQGSEPRIFAFPKEQNRPPTAFLQASRDGVLSRLLPLEVLP